MGGHDARFESEQESQQDQRSCNTTPASILGLRTVSYCTENEGTPQRVRQRVAEGGHDVPMAKQIERIGRSLANGRAAPEIADLSLFVDNSEPRSNKSYSHELIAVFLGSDPLEVVSTPPKWYGTIRPGG